MAKDSNDGQFFMVFVGSKHEPAPKTDEFSNWFTGVVAIAIVMMIFMSLLSDVERKRVLDQPIRPVSCTEQQGETWGNSCENSWQKTAFRQN